MNDGSGGGTIKAVLEFQYSELLYDIKNNCYIEGRALDAHGVRHGASVEEKAGIVHLIQDVGEDGNRDRVNRVLELTHSQVTELMSAYTKRDVTKEVQTDTAEEPEVYVIMLELPSDFSQTTLDYMEKLIHEWMVARVMVDWLGMHWQEKAMVWERKAEGLEEEIRGSVNARQAYGRRRMHPF